MILTVPDDLAQATRLSGRELRQELAVALFAQDKLTLAQAARLAEIDRVAFAHLIASRGLTIHYDVLEFEEDMATLKRMGRL